MRRIVAIARKEFIHIVRDWRLMVAVLVMPLLQLFLFAYALSFDVRHIPTAVLDQDMSSSSRRLVESLRHSGYFDVDHSLRSMDEVDHVFLTGADRAAVIIAPGFGDRLAQGRPGEVAVLLDGSEPNSAQLGRGFAVGLTRAFGVRVSARAAELAGADVEAVGRLQPRLRMWYNPEALSSNFLVPGLIVVIIMIVTVQQTAVTLVKERDQGTLEQLIASPIRRGELMLGKVAPWVILAVVDFIVLSLAGLIVFGVPFRGDVSVFIVASALFVLCCLSLGLLVSAKASSPETANQIALVLSFLPGFMLSDFVFPLGSIPVVLRYLSFLFPGRYMVAVARGAFLKGAGWEILWPQVAGLAIYAAVALTITTLAYRKRV